MEVCAEDGADVAGRAAWRAGAPAVRAAGADTAAKSSCNSQSVTPQIEAITPADSPTTMRVVAIFGGNARSWPGGDALPRRLHSPPGQKSSVTLPVLPET